MWQRDGRLYALDRGDTLYLRRRSEPGDTVSSQSRRSPLGRGVRVSAPTIVGKTRRLNYASFALGARRPVI